LYVCQHQVFDWEYIPEEGRLDTSGCLDFGSNHHHLKLEEVKNVGSAGIYWTLGSGDATSVLLFSTGCSVVLTDLRLPVVTLPHLEMLTE
jgi:hypothetical protein